MSSQDIWCLLRYLPLTIPYPYHYPVSCVFCKCKKHIKIIGISKPSRSLYAIWIVTICAHVVFASLLLAIFLVEINLNKPTLSTTQTVFYCVFGAACSGAAGPLYLVAFLIHDGQTPTELMKLENRLLCQEGRLEFVCKGINMSLDINLTQNDYCRSD